MTYPFDNLVLTDKEKMYVEYVSCISRIVVPPYISVDENMIKHVIARVFHEDLWIHEIEALLEKALSFNKKEAYMLGVGYTRFDEYIKFLARALYDCREYAKRYKKCRKLEERNASPDEIEICYEKADKLRPPILIWLGT